MKQVFAFLLIAAIAGLCFWFWVAYRRWSERQRNSEERLASAMAEAMTAKAQPASDPAALSQQKLLYEAAAKAGEAGEAVLAIQLYARLISRYPNSALGAQARAAVEAQKKKLVKR
jgi:TolA-binding protein